MVVANGKLTVRGIRGRDDNTAANLCGLGGTRERSKIYI